jgi:uncharacterized repeat protein (TIGR01451 family)
MKSQARLAIYIGVAAALLLVFLLAPGAWAEPLQNRQGQTVPTRTPVGGAAPTAQPTESPDEPEQPPAPPPSNGTPAAPAPAGPRAPAGGATPPASPARAGALALTKTAVRVEAGPGGAARVEAGPGAAGQAEAWPGAVVQFTLTLTNRGSASVRDVVITDELPKTLEPGAATGAGVSWNGRTLTARRAILPPGGRMVVTFAARVAADAPLGGVIVNTATASATGVTAVTAAATLVMPPLELPPVGGKGCDGR